MSDVPEAPKCVVCGQGLPTGEEGCPACGISGPWQDLLAAAEFACDCFARWSNDGTIGDRSSDAIAHDCQRQRELWIDMAKRGQTAPDSVRVMSADRCWSCQTSLAVPQEQCPNCGAPVRLPQVRSLRFWVFVSHQIKARCDAGQLPLSQAHACMNATKSQIAALRNRLEKDRVTMAEAVPERKPQATAKAGGTAGSAGSGDVPSNAAGRVASAARREPRRPLLEIILDPRTIQWLLGLGGVLLVVGLVIWLAAVGVFENPVVVAVTLGGVNLAVLASGWATIRFSRYQTVGRFITLLACLVMPLNLWFYHAQGLITIDGHLWAAALVCCVLYLAAALVLRDQLFVYVFTGGIAMTGLLMLADAHLFWEIARPAALLVALGLISIHVERAFPEVEGPFSRRKFGMAFFQSGQALLTAGLLLVLGAQIAGDWLYKPIFEPLYQHWKLGPPAIVAELRGQILALALVLAGSYAYFYSDIVVRRVGLYVYLAVFTLLWAEMLVIELIAPQAAVEVAIIALSLTGLAANFAQPKLLEWQKPGSPDGKPDGLAAAALSAVRAGQPLGLFLSTVPILLGLALHLRATYRPTAEFGLAPLLGVYEIGWLYVVAMLATAVSCRIGAHLYRHSVPWLATTYFFGTAAATLMGVVGLLSVCGIRTWDHLAPLVMIVPILYMIASRLYRGHSQETPLAWVAHAATGVMIVSVLAAATHLTPQHVVEPVAGAARNLLLAAFFAEAALFYLLAGAFRKQGFNVYLGTAAACGAVWQLLLYWHVGAEYYTLIFALLGLGLLVCYRLAVLEWTGLAVAAFQCANALMSLSFVAAALITLSRLAGDRAAIGVSLILLLLALTALSLLAAWLVRDAAGRRWYFVTAIAEAGLTFITLQIISNLTLWEKGEIFSIVAGLATLVVGHVGWHCEREDGQSDLVSFGLLFGSLLVALPLTIAVLFYRCRPEPIFSTPNELGMLVAGILLLATGFVFQLRATTITGAGMLLIYLLSLLLFINMLENVQLIAIWLMIGGGVVVGTGIVLSVYRERLLTLPDKARRREGVFRVLGWR
jgi:hypothetical protein